MELNSKNLDSLSDGNISDRKGRRIAFIMNKPVREQKDFESIVAHLQKQDPSAECILVHLYSGVALEQLAKFWPDTIVTFPPTGINMPPLYYMLKMMFGCRFLCFSTEGAMIYTDLAVKSFAGQFASHGSTLVDGFIFWGEAQRTHIGNEFLKHKKVSSPNRLLIAGYPHYDTFFEDNLTQQLSTLAPYHRENVILFLTGFTYAEYSDQDLLMAEDLFDPSSPNGKKDFLLAQQARHGNIIAREEFIRQIKVTATENPHKLIIVKKHPTEFAKGITFYEKELSNFENIYIPDKNVDINGLLKNSGVVVHYGSTCVAAAYLAGAFTIFTKIEELHNTEIGKFYSCKSIEASQIAETIKTLPKLALPVPIPDDIRSEFLDNFNVDLSNNDCCAAKSMANIVLDESLCPYQPLHQNIVDMKYFIKYAKESIDTYSRFTKTCLFEAQASPNRLKNVIKFKTILALP